MNGEFKNNMKIKSHWLEKSDLIKHNVSNNIGGDLIPDSIIVHFTAGGSLDSSIKWMNREGSKVSCHLAVGQKGEIIQMVPFNKIAWHAGKSSHHGIDGLNKCSIGIEIDNAGMLDESVDGESFYSWFEKKYEAKDVFCAGHRNSSNRLAYWHKFTKEQIEDIQDICELLINTYPTIKYILGHDEISPGRKIDPGPAFPIEKIRDRILNSDRHLDDKADESRKLIPDDQIVEVNSKKIALVIAENALNFRHYPNTGDNKILPNGLPKGTKVKIIKEDRSDGWVRINLEGYVSGKYLKEVE